MVIKSKSKILMVLQIKFGFNFPLFKLRLGASITQSVGRLVGWLVGWLVFNAKLAMKLLLSMIFISCFKTKCAHHPVVGPGGLSAPPVVIRGG